MVTENQIFYAALPFEGNFGKDRNRQKYRHSLKEHAKVSKSAKFGFEML